MNATIREITDSDFDSVVIDSGKPVVVDFWATWCVPCRRLEEVLETAAERYSGKIEFCKVDVNGNSGVTSRFSVRNIPLLLFFNNGELVDRTAGSISEDLLREKLEGLLNHA